MYAIALVIIRMILWPIQWIQNVLFPFTDMDEMSPAVTAKAACQFIAYLRSLQQQQQQSITQTLSSITSSVKNSSSSSVINRHNSSPQSSSLSSSSNNNNNKNNKNTISINDAWCNSGFENAKQDAITKQCLLLIYIHAPFHRNSDTIAMNFLNSKTFLEYISEVQVIALGVSIHTTQGYRLCNLFNIKAFPALVVLQPESAPPITINDNSISATGSSAIRNIPLQVVLKAESIANLQLPKIMPHLMALLTRYQVIVAERDMKRLQRLQEIELRKQQDDEYQATLLADQERERLVQEQKKQEEIEKQKGIEVEQQKINNWIKKKESLQPEPDSNSISNHNKESITTIRFILPNGTKINRKFYGTDTIETLRTYIQIYFHESSAIQNDILNVGLSTNISPRTTYNDPVHDTNKTLLEAGLHPHAVLMVQDLDS